ncbi:MAG: alanine--tRNA ligase, partial [Clostridiales bacterium]|nr:alanine--tRNA ligase [Clostridiales bacterium]
MKKYGLNELREMFLSFFESKGHLRLPSFSLIPQNDASLLLINSGMAPMKPWFTGEQEPPRRRVCTCQKCIRTGDIENIGKTGRHGTYFEMLGNFSFGDYFKREAITWSWEFLTSTVGIDPSLLYPSVYEKDDEAFDIWNKEIGIPAERIYRFGKQDNYWEHGAGPCGPCSEIYFDRGPERGCGQPECTVGCECDRYIEVWNNVFTQFNNDGKCNYTELEQKNIDTGMGLERLAVVCQDVDSIFDVDTLMSITNKVSEITGAKYGQSHKTDVSLRVITDHIRSSTMMICDGVLPSNEGRGYVLRRLLRRAARHGKLLGVAGTFLWEVCATVIEENRNVYLDLVEKQDYITRIIKVEEENFNKTIDAGMGILAELMAAHKAKNETVFSGENAFKLYDTYGFPVDLTLEIIEEQGFTLDRSGFDSRMKEQRDRARAARAALGELAWTGIELGLDNTPTEFTGYERYSDQARILAIVSDGELCSSIRTGDEAAIVLDKTPFYAEMGGQSADHGIISAYGDVFMVTDVQKNKGGKYLHSGVMVCGELGVDDTVKAEIDGPRRFSAMPAHSATHLLQKALRTILG